MNYKEDAEEKLASIKIKYDEIEEIRVKDGINSKIFAVIKNGRRKYAFKFYKMPTKEDSRNRAMRESKYLDYLEIAGFKAKPRKIVIDEKNQWGLITWLEGTKSKKLKSRDINQIVSFIDITNREELFITKEKKALPHASEAWLSNKDVVESIKSKTSKVLGNLLNKNCYVATDTVAQKLIQEIHDGVNKEMDVFENYENKGYWSTDQVGNYASPSDVGIHNTILIGSEINFLDFEYAGIDDVSKFVADWVMQPTYEFSEKEEEVLITQVSKIKRIEQNDSEWIHRYRNIKKLNAYKWAVIILQGCMGGEILASQKMLARAESYLKRQLVD